MFLLLLVDVTQQNNWGASFRGHLCKRTVVASSGQMK